MSLRCWGWKPRALQLGPRIRLDVEGDKNASTQLVLCLDLTVLAEVVLPRVHMDILVAQGDSFPLSVVPLPCVLRPGGCTVKHLVQGERLITMLRCWAKTARKPDVDAGVAVVLQGYRSDDSMVVAHKVYSPHGIEWSAMALQELARDPAPIRAAATGRPNRRRSNSEGSVDGDVVLGQPCWSTPPLKYVGAPRIVSVRSPGYTEEEVLEVGERSVDSLTTDGVSPVFFSHERQELPAAQPHHAPPADSATIPMVVQTIEDAAQVKGQLLPKEHRVRRALLVDKKLPDMDQMRAQGKVQRRRRSIGSCPKETAVLQKTVTGATADPNPVWAPAADETEGSPLVSPEINNKSPGLPGKLVEQRFDSPKLCPMFSTNL